MSNLFTYDIGKSTMFVFDSSKKIKIRQKGERKGDVIYNPHEYSKEDFLDLIFVDTNHSLKYCTAFSGLL